MSAAVASQPLELKKGLDWAAEEDDNQQVASSKTPASGIVEERDEGNGVKVVVEYKTNEDGKKVKITRRVRRTLIRTQVNQASVSRQSWTKFGQEKGRASGPHMSTTTIGENVQLKMSAGGSGKKVEEEVSPEDKMKQELAGKKIQCRTCKGDHFTSRCPYKDTLGAVAADADTPDGEGSMTPNAALIDPSNPAVAASSLAGLAAGGLGGGGSKYVPPSRRAGADGKAAMGERMGGPLNRDDLPTLRVTNLADDVEDDDLRELFSHFGRVIRVYVGRDRETGESRGFAFVSMSSREEADRARQRVDGMGYANLILSVQWSQPRGERPGGA